MICRRYVAFDFIVYSYHLQNNVSIGNRTQWCNKIIPIFHCTSLVRLQSLNITQHGHETRNMRWRAKLSPPDYVNIDATSLITSCIIYTYAYAHCTCQLLDVPIKYTLNNIHAIYNRSYFSLL